MTTGRFIGGLMVGGIIGAVIGLLIAPRPGEETREMMRDELSNRWDASIGEAKTRALELREKALETAETLNQKGHAVAEELEQTGRDTWDKLRSTIKSPTKSPTKITES